MFVLSYKFGDCLNGQVLVLRNGDVADVLPIDLLLFTADEIFQEVDRHLLYKICSGRPRSRIRIRKIEALTIGWEVDPTIHSTKVVALSLATVLGSKGRR